MKTIKINKRISDKIRSFNLELLRAYDDGKGKYRNLPVKQVILLLDFCRLFQPFDLNQLEFENLNQTKIFVRELDRIIDKSHDEDCCHYIPEKIWDNLQSFIEKIKSAG